MENNKKRLEILIVEDNPKYRQTAKRYFDSVPDMNVEFANDYDSAQERLEQKKYDGVAVDIFFPKAEGSGDKSMGVEAFYRILEVLAPTYDISDDTMRAFGRYQRAKGAIPKELYLESITIEDRANKGLLSLKKDIESDDEAQQPLGILLMERLIERRIPYAVATSGWHHDLNYEPIFRCFWQEPFKMSYSRVVEGYRDRNKRSIEYWKDVREALMSAISDL